MKLNNHYLILFLIVAGGLAFHSRTWASGYQFGSQSVSGQGSAHANGAETDDPSTIFSNPAGLARLEGTQLSLGTTAVLPFSTYTDQGSVTAIGDRVSGDPTNDHFAPTIVLAPSFYLSHAINDQWHVGLGMFVPYGAKMDYGSNWPGRYALTSIDLKSVNINPSLSFRLTPHHSFGFGVSAQYLDASLDQAADAYSGLYELLRLSGHNDADTINLLKDVKGDGMVDVSGDSWSYGWNIGYLYELDENTRFGLAYRSAINHSLNGSSHWSFNQVSGTVDTMSAAGLLALAHISAPASVSVTTPETVSANFFKQLTSRWAVMSDLTWTRNSRLENIIIKQKDVDTPNGTVSQGDMTIYQHWRNTWRLALGANYRYNDNWLLRSGIAFDQSPVTSSEERHPAIPDSHRQWLSLGANYTINKNNSLDLAYSLLHFNDSSTHYHDTCTPDSTECTGNGGQINGNYSNTYIHMLALQYNYRF